MKKLRAMYKGYMLHPILYKTVTRTSIVAVLMLLWEPQKKFHATRSIMDYADEKIVSFEELEPEERTYCSMLSNLVLGVPLVVVALCISFL